jgi:hypothetical protein
MYGCAPDKFLFQPLAGKLTGSTLAVNADSVTPVTLAFRILEAERAA